MPFDDNTPLHMEYDRVINYPIFLLIKKKYTPILYDPETSGVMSTFSLNKEINRPALQQLLVTTVD